MYTTVEYGKLKKKYGSCSSWAIWNEGDQRDTSVIDGKIDQLNTKYVFLGLNPSDTIAKLPSWSNFHVGRHDRKLMFSCSNSELSGSYLTDIFKGIPTTNAAEFAVELEKCVTKDPEFINKQVDDFNTEMTDIKMNKDTVFIVLGNDAKRYFKKYFQKGFKNNVLYIRHYSSRGTDEGWVNELGKELGIKKIEEWRKGELNM